MGNFRDLSGKTFGDWTVLKRTENKENRQTAFLCRCVCGTVRAVLASSLTGNKSTNCGCWRKNTNKTDRKNETGKTYGIWTVLSRVPNSKPVRYLCRCQCGTVREVVAASLRNKSSTNCGCRRLRLEDSVAARNKLYTHYRHGATKTRKLEFSLTREEFFQIVGQNCSYCGAAPSNVFTIKSGDSFVYNGIDRKDNSVGYQLSNAVPCCKICNYAKMQMSILEFKEWITRIYSHFCA